MRTVPAPCRAAEVLIQVSEARESIQGTFVGSSSQTEFKQHAWAGMHDLALCLVCPICCIGPSWLPTTTSSNGHTCHVTACPAVAKRGPKKTGRKPGRPAVKKASTAPAKKGPGRPKGSGRSAKAGLQGRRGKHVAQSPTAAAQAAHAQAADPQKLNEARDSTADVQLEVVGTGVNSTNTQPNSSITRVSLCICC